MQLRLLYLLAAVLVWTVFTLPVLAQTPTTKPADPIDAKLNSRIDINLTGLTTEQAVIKLQDEQRLNLLIDWDGLKEKGLSRTQDLTGRLTNVTIREAIHVILTEGGCTEIPPMTQDGHLLRISLNVETRVFPVGRVLDRIQKDLSSTTAGAATNPTVSEATDRLVRAIQDHIDAASWRENGGTVGSISIIGRRAIISQTPAALARIEKLLRELENDDAK